MLIFLAFYLRISITNIRYLMLEVYYYNKNNECNKLWHICRLEEETTNQKIRLYH
jgi:hypothetical protein